MCKIGQDILKLGLLFGSLQGDEALVDEQPEWLTFAHKLFQDFAAGFYISKTKVNLSFPQFFFNCMIFCPCIYHMKKVIQ